MSRVERLRAALGALSKYGSGARLRAALRNGAASRDDEGPEVAFVDHDSVFLREAEDLDSRDIDVCFYGENAYPVALASLPKAPPVLFTWGNTGLLSAPGVGMCGSRYASEKGMQAASVCGEEVARHSLAVISGYAKGVDTATHLAALRSGGRTVIVLAEGICGFRKKKAFDSVPLDDEHALVISQFAPTQRWSVGAAMTRNAVIAGLGKALVVIEAGETGGTLDAARQAMAMGRPVLALEFTEGTPMGNQALLRQGAIPIRSRSHLGRALDAIGAAPSDQPVRVEQLGLL